MSDTTLTIQRVGDRLELVGEAPPLIYIAEELLRGPHHEQFRVAGSDIYIDVEPPLHYRIVGDSSHGVWVAERVTPDA